MSAAQGRGIARWALAALLALTLLAYWPSLSAGFTNWDDDGYVTENVAVQRGDVVALLLEPFEGNHHPATMLSLGANHAWSGLDAGSYHLVNVLLHLACTLLVFLFVSGLLERQAMPRSRAELVALGTSVVFALYPMHVESVAWVSARKDPLYTLFFLLALLVYLRHGDRPRVGTLLAALAFGALAMLSKPAAVVLPVALVLVDWLRARPLRRGVLAEKLPFFALSIGVGLATLSAQHAAGATSADSAVPLGRSLLHACYGLMMYGVRFLAPLDLAPFYPLPDASAELPGSYLLAPLVVLTLAAVAVVLHRKGARTALFALAFFVLNLALVLQVKQVGGAVMADRYTYVPYIGLGLLAGLLLERATRERGDGVALASIGVLGLALAPLAWRQAGFWRDSETLWERALAVAPSGRAFANRGQLRQRAGDAAGALADYEQALALEPGNVAANSNCGILMLERNELDEALIAFEAALAREPRNGPALVGRALVRHRRGDVAGALADCDTAVAANPTDAIARGNRGFFRQQRGDDAAAKADYDAALALDPALEVARAGLASLASGETGAQRSLEGIERALELKPATQPCGTSAPRSFRSSGGSTRRSRTANERSPQHRKTFVTASVSASCLLSAGTSNALSRSADACSSSTPATALPATCSQRSACSKDATRRHSGCCSARSPRGRAMRRRCRIGPSCCCSCNGSPRPCEISRCASKSRPRMPRCGRTSAR